MKKTIKQPLNLKSNISKQPLNLKPNTEKQPLNLKSIKTNKQPAKPYGKHNPNDREENKGW